MIGAPGAHVFKHFFFALLFLHNLFFLFSFRFLIFLQVQLFLPSLNLPPRSLRLGFGVGAIGVGPVALVGAGGVGVPLQDAQQLSRTVWWMHPFCLDQARHLRFVLSELSSTFRENFPIISLHTGGEDVGDVLVSGQDTQHFSFTLSSEHISSILE